MSLKVNNLSAGIGNLRILHDIDLKIEKGTLHVLMGPNGSGKSTFASVLMGNPKYKRVEKKPYLSLNGKDISNFEPHERAKCGLFLAFQNPSGIPGVSVANLLKTSYQTVQRSDNTPSKKSAHNPALSVFKFHQELVLTAERIGVPRDFLGRSLDGDFSGGEKKKLEMLQAIVLKPKYAVFDEIDTGLDVDALKTIAGAILELKKKGTGILVVTHYHRILEYAKPDVVHVLVKGRIVASGGCKLALEIEKNGYSKWSKSKN